VRQVLIAALFGAGIFLLAQPLLLADYPIAAHDAGQTCQNRQIH
jgi:hypothetical protein